MERAGYTDTTLAPKLHVDRRTVGNWVRDKGSPNPIILEKFAEICDVPYEWLEEGTIDGASTMWYGDREAEMADLGSASELSVAG